MISGIAKLRLITIRPLMSFFLSILNILVKTDSKQMLFCSFNGQGYSDNPKYIFEYLKKSSKYTDYTFIWALKDVSNQKIPGAKLVKFNSLKYYYYLAKSKYWIFNAKMAPYYQKKKNQVYLQTWHGTPLKKLANDIKDNGQTYYRSKQSYQQMVDSYKNDSRHWDYLLSPNRFSSEVFQSAFGISKTSILEVGYPRVDYLVNHTEFQVEKLKEKWGINKEKKVILYAPTWRDDSYHSSGYTFNLVLDFYKWKKVLGESYIVLFKPHYLIANTYSVPDDLSDFVLKIESKVDINELYLISDSLVTDYSSVFFDYAVLNRPIYFYMYDYEKYKEELRGFYLEVPTDLPNEICETEKELLVALQSNLFDYARLTDFNRRFNTWNDGNVVKKIVNRGIL